MTLTTTTNKVRIEATGGARTIIDVTEVGSEEAGTIGTKIEVKDTIMEAEDGATIEATMV